MTLIDYVKLGNITKIQELIDHGVDLNVQDEYGYTPLIWAASCNKPDIVELLMEAGADPKIIDIDSHTAMFWANYYKNLEVIDLLNKNLDGKQTLTKKKKGK
jgi:ankyrin repeat protein